MVTVYCDLIKPGVGITAVFMFNLADVTLKVILVLLLIVRGRVRDEVTVISLTVINVPILIGLIITSPQEMVLLFPL